MTISGNPNTVITYAYDPFGRRIQKNVNGTITNYVYDKDAIILAYDQYGNVQTRFTQGLRIDEPLAVDNTSQVYYYHADGLGSIAALTNASQSVVQSYAYDTFGNITNGTPTITQPYTYTAREYDSETGLYFYRARYYDPTVGRFLTRDPIGLRGGFNLYTYVKNNAINRKDPLGLFDNPLVKIPSFSDSFPNSKCAAPIADIIAGGIEAGFAISFGIASAVGSAAGPEFWWMPVLYGGAVAEAGADAIDRISTGIETLGKQECKPKCQ